MKRRRKIKWEQRIKLIDANYAALFEEYSEHVIKIPQHSMWDYAIPEMYWNMSDGFLWPKTDNYRGMPMLSFGGKTLYLRHHINNYRLEENEFEKMLCFDRQNNKYTVIIEESSGVKELGNPSYFRFLPKVKKYVSKSERLRRIKENKNA